MTEHSTTPATKRERKMARTPKPDRAEAGAGPAIVDEPEATIAKPQSKSALVLELLRRQEGATLDQMVTATGWLAHTTRAALTGLKKKGHVITSDKPEGQGRTYRITAK